MTETQAPTRTNGHYNRAAMKRQALKVSEEVRAGKFSRVSEQFLNDVEAEIETFIRRMPAPVQSPPFIQVDPPKGEKFLTGAGEQKLIEAFNTWIAREIHRQANKVRTGKTL